MDAATLSTLRNYLSELYPAENLDSLLERLIREVETLGKVTPPSPQASRAFSQADSILIAYPDHIQEDGLSPLETLNRFLLTYLSEYITGIHILPFFPSSSDDGFSVIDFTSVDPRFGTWSDIQKIGQQFRLMVDLVINHISAKSKWFQDFLEGVEPYDDYFIQFSPETDLSMVVRPRDLPLLSHFKTKHDEIHVWTTFSPDQIDLNFQNPNVLIEMIRILLDYASKGAQIIRLDAIAFLWKEQGTASIHLPQTHTVVKLLRKILAIYAPWVYIITETNVPHEENLSYFGDGSDEAHLVYQFALPPLTIHSLLAGDATVLSHWATALKLPTANTTFFNFLASHDGIGLRPIRDLLDGEAVQQLVDTTTARAGAISHRRVGTGKREPYELNITLFDMLSEERQGTAPSPLSLQRYLAAQAIMLSLQGVPGIYLHSLFGGRNNLNGMRALQMKRAINREKFEITDLAQILEDPHHYSHHIFSRYCQLLRARRTLSAFTPYGMQEVLDLHPALFSLVRISPEDGSRVLCLHNVSANELEINQSIMGASTTLGTDILQSEPIMERDIKLGPYQCRWIALNSCH